MKKFSVVLLIAVLAASFAFAGFTGKASVWNFANLDTTDWGLTTDSSVELTWNHVIGEGNGSSKGEGDVYAEIEATFKVEINFDKVTSSDSSIDVKLNGMTVSKANIIVKDWTIDILAAKGSKGFAMPYDKAAARKTDDNLKLEEKMDGVTIGYKTYKLALSYRGNIDNKMATIWGAVQSGKINLAEGMTLEAAGFGRLNKAGSSSTKAIGAAAKFAAKMDAVDASVAVDATYKSGDHLTLEVAQNAKVGIITEDAYFFFKQNPKDMILSARVKAALGEDASVAVEGRDLLVESARKISLTAKDTYEAFTTEFTYGITLASKVMDVEIAETYNHDMFTAYASVGWKMGDGSPAAKFAVWSITPVVKVSTTKLINNATVELAWTDAEYTPKSLAKNGQVSLKAEVKF